MTSISCSALAISLSNAWYFGSDLVSEVAVDISRSVRAGLHVDFQLLPVGFNMLGLVAQRIEARDSAFSFARGGDLFGNADALGLELGDATISMLQSRKIIAY